MHEKKVLMCGNEAAGEAAIQAGCRFYAGYPITPQNELTAYMAGRMPEVGGTFIQSESELAAVSMIFGASAAGARAMTSSSSPGISLKQEGISYLVGNELPAVIVNMMRGGPGLGNIGPSQSDYFQATRGGGHGDYNMAVLAPSTVQELADLMKLAFELADKYRNPVIVLADGIIGQMMEPVEIKKIYPEPSEKDWILTGAAGRESRVIRSLFLKEGELEEHNNRLQEKFGRMKESELLYEEMMIDDAELVIAAYGTSARIAKSAVINVRKEGINAGMIRPVTLWPFPEKQISAISERAKSFLVVEMSAGQMIEDVRLAVEGRAPVHFYGRTGGEVPSVSEIEKKIKEII